jgi:hypothetical protein
MLQKSIWDVTYVVMAIYTCCKHMFSGVSNACSKCFRCFLRMLQVFYLDVGYVVMAIHVCFKCFTCFQSQVSSVSTGCFKSRFGEAHVAMTWMAGGQWPAIATCYYC